MYLHGITKYVARIYSTKIGVELRVYRNMQQAMTNSKQPADADAEASEEKKPETEVTFCQ
jgi:hypothetical protein